MVWYGSFISYLSRTKHLYGKHLPFKWILKISRRSIEGKVLRRQYLLVVVGLNRYKKLYKMIYEFEFECLVYSLFLMFQILQLIYRKDSNKSFEMVDPEAHAWLTTLSNLNIDAESVHELYPNSSLFSEPGSILKEMTPTSLRLTCQKELRYVIKKLESSRTISNEFLR